jgi:hypothetical protein
MPEVPRVTRVVDPAPLPGAEFRPEISREGAGIGRGAAARDKAVIDMAAEATERADSLAIAKADRFLAERAAAVEKLAREARGLDAVAAAEKALADFDNEYLTVQKELRGADQELAVEDAAFGRRMALNRSLEVHVAGERERYDNETTKTLLEADALEIRRNYLDHAIVEERITHAKNTFEAFGRRKGMAQETIDLEKAKLESGARADVVRSYIANEQPEEGSAYLKLHWEHIIPREREQLRDDLKDATNRNKASDIADDLVRKAIEASEERIPDEIVIQGMFNIPAGMELDVTRTVREPTVGDIAEDLKEYDPDLRREIRALVATRLTDYNVSEESSRRARYTHASEQVRASGGNIGAIDSLTWAHMSLPEHDSLREYAAALKEPTPIETDIEVYDWLMRMASQPDKKPFMMTEIDRLAAKLSDADRRKFIDIQYKIRNGDMKTLKELDDYRSVDRIVSDAILISGAFGSRDDKGKAQFRAAVSQELLRHPDASRDDIEKFVNRMLGAVVIERGWLDDTERRYWKLAPEERLAEVDYDEIPPEEREEITDMLEEEYEREPTKEEVQEEYLTRLKTFRWVGE